MTSWATTALDESVAMIAGGVEVLTMAVARGRMQFSGMFMWLGKHPYLTLALVSAGLAVLVVLGSLGRDRGTPAQDLKRPRRIIAAVFGVLSASSFLVLEYAQQPWLWLLALVPTSSVLYQALSLAIFKNKLFFNSSRLPPRPAAGTQPFLAPLMNAAWTEERRYYSTSSLALRFGLPALLLGAVAITTMWCLFNGEFLDSLPWFIDPLQKPKLIVAARLGLAGAYLYVVMYLGNRGFRGDVTPGAAMWSTLTLVAGPIFAVVLVYIAKPLGDDRWAGEITPFAAGFSLRYVSNVVEVAIRRLMGDGAESAARSVSLMQLRGVSKDVEQRFAEEGIENVAELAMANPHRLRRNTGYDKRQIVGWIDQALLMTSLPLAWQSLETEGITGAIDLVWYVSAYSETSAVAAADRRESFGQTLTLPEEVRKLALRNKLDPDSLWEAMLRLYSDQQVRLNWALYQLDERETDASAEGAQNELLSPS